MKNMKKFLALTLSAAMVMGMSMTSFAAEATPGQATIEAPIYAMDITQVLVPTKFVVAFNPDGYKVVRDSSDTIGSTDQIITDKYGIINKSSKNKLVTVTFDVQDKNNMIEFDTDDNVGTAQTNSSTAYKMSLNVAVANETEVKSSANLNPSFTKEAVAADLNNVNMTAVTSGTGYVQLTTGETDVAFWLAKGKYTGDIDMSKNKPVTEQITLTGLADDGKGVTGFTFAGKLNNKADWSKATQPVVIKAVYDVKTAADLTAESGTGAYVAITPVFASNAAKTITYTVGSGASKITVKAIKVKATDGIYYDIYSQLGSVWAAATDNSGTITIADGAINFYSRNYPSASTVPAIVTYEKGTDNPTTETAKVKLMLR